MSKRLHVVVVSRIQRIVFVTNPKKLPALYTVANPARGLLDREKRRKEKSGSTSRPTPHAARSEKK